MTTHLSVRLCWHDSGWNGRICRNPKKNRFCTFLPHIRDAKDRDFEKFETANRGKHLCEFDYEKTLVPCRGEICVFSEEGYLIKFEHPLKGVVPGYNLGPTIMDPTPFSFYPAPYRWLMVENYDSIREKENLELRDLTNKDLFYSKRKKKTWIDDVKLQGKLLEVFWDRLTENKSIVVFYVNSTPAAEETRRVIVGMGRLKKKFKMSFFGKSEEKPGPNYVWQRRLSHNYPQEGFRLPYQEYLEQGVDPKDVVLTVPQGFENEFKYVAEHVSDGALLSITEKMSGIVERIRTDIGIKKISLPGDWERRSQWIQNVLEELWEDRGKYPGIGSVLRFLGFIRSTTYHQEILIPLEKDNKDALQHTLQILDGKRRPERNYEDDFENARRKWNAYCSNQDYRDLLMLLMRLELTEDQVERLVKRDLRSKSGINLKERDMVDNPYLIAEYDNGLLEKGKILSERIPLDIIDHAMVPSFYFPGKYRPDDDRRIRAIMTEELRDAAEQGDTLLSLKEISRKVRKRFPGERQCKPDLFLLKANKAFYESKSASRLTFVGKNDEFISLKEMRRFEGNIAERVRDLIKVEYEKEAPNWKEIMDTRFGKASDSALGPEIEKKAREEKAEALNILYSHKFSSLTGRAGTGKTEVLTILVEGIISQENASSSDFLILAPTGKARVRLKKHLNEHGLHDLEPKTIHQHLNENEWLDDSFKLKKEGGEKVSAKTIVVDESSMVPVDLLATLMESIKFSNVDRFILGGDPNQLPPIGPGRPFDDIVKWLKEDKKRAKHLATLAVRTRHTRRDRESVCLRLADGFLRDFKPKDIEEVYSLIEKNKLDEDDDLHFEKWEEHEDLITKLDDVLEKIGVTDYESYRESVGITTKDVSKCESWQVLSPLKYREVSGTRSLNCYLQDMFLGWRLDKWRTGGYYGPGKRCPRPFGVTKDIIHEDKVIQTRNTRKLKCYPRKKDKYVANGEIGIATLPYGMNLLNVSFSDQPESQYTYYKGEGEQSVEKNLDLAYAITIHKSQGSDFDNVAVIIPERAFNISMEMMYTALTRFTDKTYLLIQGGIDTLEKYRHASSSETDKRNTFLFKIAVRDDVEKIPYAENRIHRTKTGFLVRSKSEVIVANELINAGIPLTEGNYEQKLYSKDDPYDYRLPDYTFEYKGGKYYWEHLGMLSLESYRKSWERKHQWYKENGYEDNLIVSQDGLDGSIDSQKIDKIIEERIGIQVKKVNSS